MMDCPPDFERHHKLTPEERAGRKLRRRQANGANSNPPRPAFDFSGLSLTLNEWAALELPTRTCLLGDVFTTTTRAMLSARTGLGKTNLGFALGFAMATGSDFCHWRGYEPARVLLVDGEMSRELMQERLADAERRTGVRPDHLFAICKEQAEDMPPLDTEDGQDYLDALVEYIGGADFIIFDNVMSLTAGDLKEPQAWSPVTRWIKTLTGRHIGCLWISHTGYDGTRTYGDNTREWQMDVVMIAEGDDTSDHLSFTLKFTKARQRTPDNRDDFEPVTLSLIDDQWSATAAPRGGGKRKMPQHASVARETLQEAIEAMGEPPPPVGPFPDGVKVVKLDTWRTYFNRRVPLDCANDAEPAERKKANDTRRKRFQRAREAMEEANGARCIDGHYWIV